MGAPAAAPASPAATVSDQQSPARTVRDRPSPEDSDDRSSKVRRTTSTDGLSEPADGETVHIETEDGGDAGAQQHPATPPHAAEEAEEEYDDSESDVDGAEFANSTLQDAQQAMDDDSESEEEGEQEDSEEGL